MQFLIISPLLAILGLASAAAECPRENSGNGPYLNNRLLNAPTQTDQTSTFNWAGNTILVKMQKIRGSCDPEGDCDDDITFNLKNKGTKTVRVRIEEGQNDHIGLVLAPGADCDLNRYFQRSASPYQVSFA
ncbi:hypothetical protein CNYM01_13848 [Colletotrichum nymphaeae SA-01]|uniref:Uncharacterized protein n=1 Tax=Colletotrichum nymphaeae SA-01 TaxID=1460502 RepID=A0A135TJB9_9PEZI|nr:hypothetical protein CNYM01_13848 [Colletotrichum nymphaeae SA-01]